MSKVVWRLSLKSCFILVIGAVFCFNLSAQSDNFTKGEESFKNDEPEKAIPYLKKAVVEGTPKAYIYLSIVYYQTGKFQESINICQAGMKAQGTDKKKLAYNAGNSAFALGDYSGAETWYSTAITASPLYAEPVLNRANARLEQMKYKDAREDYIHYLELAPEDSQESQIHILIGLLDDQIAADEKAEAEKLAEEQRLKDEAARLAQEEADRRKKMLEDVANSLQNTDTENMTAGAEGTVNYDYESELE